MPLQSPSKYEPCFASRQVLSKSSPRTPTGAGACPHVRFTSVKNKIPSTNVFICLPPSRIRFPPRNPVKLRRLFESPRCHGILLRGALGFGTRLVRLAVRLPTRVHSPQASRGKAVFFLVRDLRQPARLVNTDRMKVGSFICCLLVGRARPLFLRLLWSGGMRIIAEWFHDMTMLGVMR